MLEAIKEIGDLFRKRDNISVIDTLIQDPKCSYLITINISSEQKGEMFKFLNVSYEQYDSQRVGNKHLYRESKGNTPPLLPTIILDKRSSPHKRINKLYICINNLVYDRFREDEKTFLQKIKDVLLKNRKTIENEIVEHFNNIKSKDSVLITLKIDNKYLGDYDIFKNLLQIKETKKYDIKSSNNCCSICGKIGDVYGNINVFRFFTQDKPGFICGGFNKQKSWRNFPVCLECKLSLEEGKKVLQNNRFQVCKGIYCYIIPKFILGRDLIKETTMDILLDMPKRLSLKDKIKNRILEDENDILDELSRENDILTLIFLFLKGTLYGSQDAEKVALLIEDIFPSRLRRIFEAKEKVDKIYNTKEPYTFANLRYFFEKSDKDKKDYDLNRYFLEIVESIFKDKKIDLQFLIKFFIRRIREDLSANEYYYKAIENAIKNIIFLETLSLISFKKEVVVMSQFEELFKKFGSAFESPLKRGLFLLGALTEMLLKKQYAEKNSKPFLKQLKGLKMNEKDIKALLPKVQNKLQEYDSFDEGKRKIASEIANYLLAAGDNWKLSVDEINFYFSCGMNMMNEVASIVYSKVDTQDKQEKN